MDLTDARNEPGTLPSSTPNWTINVSEVREIPTKYNELKVRTVKVSNISLSATEKDIKAFFSFSGEIQYVEMRRETETSQLAYVTFKDSQGADAAILQAGTTIGDLSVSITRVENYQLPPDAPSSTFKEAKPTATSSAVKKTEDAVSTVLAKGFVLGKDALNKAKSFDERHHLMSNASATVASIDQKMGLTGKISIGTAVVNEKMREMNERFQVSEKTKSAFAAAEQKASTAGSAIMSNRYVLTGASWLSNAFSVVAKAAEDVSTMTKEKVGKAEEERKENLYKQRPATVNDFAQIHLDQSSVGELPVVASHSADNNVSEHAII